MKNKLLLLLSISFILFSIPSTAQWMYKAPMAVKTGQLATVAHPNGNVYVFGGFAGGSAFSTLNIYNQASNTWSAGANIPAITRGPAYALGPDSSIYCFGGYDPGELSASYKYKPSTNTWTTLASMPNAAWYAAAAKAPSGKIYVFGGESAESLTQIYDPSAGNWSSGAAIPIPVKEHGAVTAPTGKIYIIGGINFNTGLACTNVQIYDPALNSWSVGAPMPTARNQFAYTLGPDGKIYCIGGKTSQGNNSSPFFTVVEIYDPVANTWSNGTILPKGLGETACASINNGINVFGGADSSALYSNVNLRMLVSPTGIPVLSGNFSFNSYPNPASDAAHIYFSSSVVQDVIFKMIDMNGKYVYSKTINNFSGEENFDIDLNGLSRGIYLMQCICGKEFITKKLIVE